MKISIITPVYNRADCIEGCMESVSNADKSGLDIEHVVCNDGSSDNTAEIVARYAENHPHVKFVSLQHNSGPNTARNAAIAAASGQWLLFLDSDDKLAPQAFGIIAQTVSEKPGYSHYLFNCNDRIGELADFGAEKEFGFEDFLFGRVSGDFAHLFERSTALQFPFDETLRIHEGLFFLRFYRHAGRILYTAKVTHLIDRRRNDHVSFSSRKITDRALKETIIYDDLFYRFFGEELISTGHGRALLQSVLNEKYRCAVLLGLYNDADDAAAMLKSMGYAPSVPARICRTTHTGPLAWLLARNAIKIRWKFRALTGKPQL